MIWRDRAACKGMSIDVFFPRYGRNATAEAVRVCAACPVARACRDHAKTAPEPYGTWGGVPEAERPESKSTADYVNKRRRNARRGPQQPISTASGLRRHLLVDHEVYTAGWLWREMNQRHRQEHQLAADHAHHDEAQEEAG